MLTHTHWEVNRFKQFVDVITAFQTSLRGDAFPWFLWWHSVCYTQHFLPLPFFALPPNLWHFSFHFTHTCSNLQFINQLSFEDYSMLSHFQMVTLCGITYIEYWTLDVVNPYVHRDLILVILLVQCCLNLSPKSGWCCSPNQLWPCISYSTDLKDPEPSCTDSTLTFNNANSVSSKQFKAHTTICL